MEVKLSNINHLSFEYLAPLLFESSVGDRFLSFITAFLDKLVVNETSELSW